MPKPHKGTILGSKQVVGPYPEYGKNLGYIIVGHWQGHPDFGYSSGWTSLVVRKGRWSKPEHGYRACEVETLNSRYTWQEKCA